MKRSAAREVAIRLCYSAELANLETSAFIQDFFAEDHYATLSAEDELFASRPSDTQLEYINKLVELVFAHKQELDSTIEQYAKGWSLKRISKISLAINNGIPVDYKATVPEHTTVSEIDLCVVLGNLIDNAVEACEKVAPEGQFIRLYIGRFQEQLYISVSNATNETVRKLDEEYITNKRGNHGHGLKRINRIVEKYEGYINRKNEAGVFVTEIMLPL